jgi:hypothetical protein
LARGIEIRWLNTSRNDKLSETALALAVKIEQVLAKHETNEPESIEALEMMYSKIPPEALPLFQK